MPRDPEFERAFLAAAARAAGWSGDEGFPTAVHDRLARGAQEYEATKPWEARPLGTLIREAAEEASDISAWDCLSVQKLNTEVDERKSEPTEKLYELLAEIAGDAHALWRKIQAAADLEREGRGK